MSDDRTMRERIARRVLTACFEAGGSKAPPWEGADPAGREGYLAVADAILDELREPTEAMVDAGQIAIITSDAYEVWAAMIDAAKQERG